MKAAEPVHDRPRLRWLRRRLREAVRDNVWLLPALGAVTGFALAMTIGTGGGPEEDPWTISVDRSRDTLFATLGLTFTALGIVLALASVAAQNVVGRFGSRVLRIYARRSADRWVIAAFSLTAMFILTEQFQLRIVDRGRCRRNVSCRLPRGCQGSGGEFDEGTDCRTGARWRSLAQRAATMTTPVTR